MCLSIVTIIIYLLKKWLIYIGQVVNSRSQTKRGQPVTKLEAPLQHILDGYASMIQGRSIKKRIQLGILKGSKVKNIIGRCVFSETLVQ